MRKVSFIVPGRIGGKGRPRFMRNKYSGRAVVATPQKTISQEAVVKHFAHQAMVSDRLSLLEGPLEVSVVLYQHFPKSWSQKQRAATCWITGLPDCDNILKLLLDAVQGIVMSNDTQVASVHFARRYRVEGCEELQIQFSELAEIVIPKRKRIRVAA